MNRLNTLLCAAIACLTLTTTAHAWDHPHVSRSGESGNSDIKAGYKVYTGFMHCDEADLAEGAAIQAQMPAPWFPVPHPCVHDAEVQYMKLEARAEAWVKLLGRTETIAYAQAKVTDEDAFKRTSVKLKAMGNTLYSRTGDGIDIERGVSFEKKKKFGMSGINVTVRGTASAQVGVNFNGGLAGKDMVLYVTPFGDAGVSASASVGAGCANASIEGNLDAIDAEIPAELWVDLDNDGITFDIDADLKLKLMDGKIKAKLSYCLGNASKTIVSRDANRITIPLLDERFSIDF